MRLRHVTGALEFLKAHPEHMILEPAPLKGQWASRFGNGNPIHLEVGMGKGAFVCGMAKQNPDVNYLGFEKYDSVALRALQRLLEEPLPNVQLVRAPAEGLEDFFEAGEIGRVYLNFSDPWPRKAHAKRRLTHRNFLDRYLKCMGPEGELHFKTDNRGLFEWSLMHLNECGLKFQALSLDLHADEPEDNVRTEYEEAWSAKGAKIYRLVATYR